MLALVRVSSEAGSVKNNVILFNFNHLQGSVTVDELIVFIFQYGFVQIAYWKVVFFNNFMRFNIVRIVQPKPKVNNLIKYILKHMHT